jgi:probable HAF family extracellular repeat protein
LLGLACSTTQAALPEYVITDLGTLGGLRSEADDINNNGQVVGVSAITGDNASHAFLWTPGEGIRDLGVLGGIRSRANAINDNGQVVGRSDIDGTPDHHRGHAFLWTLDGGMRDLGVLGGGRESESEAYDISPDGQVVGWSETKDKDSWPHAFHWQDGVMRDLSSDPTSQQSSDANSINALGQILGVDGHIVLWAPGGGQTRIDSFGAAAINDSGQVAGTYSPNPNARAVHAVLWTAEEGNRDLGVLEGFSDSSANDINASGHVVGGSWPGDYPDGDLQVRAFLWTAAEGMQDLNEAPGVKDSGWTLRRASAINDAGQIVGYGENPEDGYKHAFLLTPVSIKCQGRLPTIIGGKGNDVLRGTSGKDVIQGGGGNDVIKAGGGNDIVCGGAGNDKLYGGTGKNHLAGGSGKDTCKQGVKSSGCER